MNINKAFVVINKTVEGISVIDIDIFNGYGEKHRQALKQIIDGLNALPGLTREDIKSVVASRFNVPINSVTIKE